MKVVPISAPVRSQVISSLRDAILQGRFLPGQKLVEADLCELMGVSRPSVREALRQLEAEKLVVITPFRGPAVARIDWDEASQIYEVRALLEGQAAYLFAQRVTDADLESMEASLRTFQAAARRGDEAGRLLSTEEFYGVMLDKCGNKVIRDLLAGLHARINFLRARSMSRAGRAKQSGAEMQRIYEALHARSPKKAQQACTDHVRLACEAAKASFADPLAASAARPARAAARKAKAGTSR
jgi:DNA-binding GntR family transcriptional regulator